MRELVVVDMVTVTELAVNVQAVTVMPVVC